MTKEQQEINREIRRALRRGELPFAIEVEPNNYYTKLAYDVGRELGVKFTTKKTKKGYIFRYAE